MKYANVSPVHKKDDYSYKKNYRPVSLLPIVSKVCGRLLSNNIYSYIEKYLSIRLCGFRKDHCAQLSLIIMSEEIRKNSDKGRFSGMLLTDLSKAFDCLVHDLLIAKLNAYGSDYNALSLINNYLSDTKQRTKIGEAFSKWTDIILEFPNDLSLGHFYLIFISMIFYFSDATTITSYADDNTPYASDTVDLVISSL